MNDFERLNLHDATPVLERVVKLGGFAAYMEAIESSLGETEAVSLKGPASFMDVASFTEVSTDTSVLEKAFYKGELAGHDVASLIYGIDFASQSLAARVKMPNPEVLAMSRGRSDMLDALGFHFRSEGDKGVSLLGESYHEFLELMGERFIDPIEVNRFKQGFGWIVKHNHDRHVDAFPGRYASSEEEMPPLDILAAEVGSGSMDTDDAFIAFFGDKPIEL